MDLFGGGGGIFVSPHVCLCWVGRNFFSMDTLLLNPSKAHVLLHKAEESGQRFRNLKITNEIKTPRQTC